MKRFTKWFSALLTTMALAGSALAQDLVTEKVTLMYMQPGQIIKVITEEPMYAAGSETPVEVMSGAGQEVRLPPGIESLIPDGVNSLLIRGTPSAIADLRQRIDQFDVMPRQVQIKVRIVQVQTLPDGSIKEDVLQAPIISTINNVPALIKVGSEQSAWSTEILPRIGTDDTFTLYMVFARSDAGRERRQRSVRRIRAGSSARIRSSLLPSTYIELTPHEIKEEPGRGTP